MEMISDLYPSRTARKTEMFERLDPVIHADGERRRAGPLTEDELQRFERDGFLIYEGFFSGDEIRKYFDELRRLSEDDALKDKESVILEPESHEVRSIFQIHKESGLFDRLSRDRRILERAQQLMGSDVYIHQSRINYKPGFKGKGFSWHSDFETWHAEDGMPQMRAVSASIILTDNYEVNGPLMLIPGSHQYFVPCVGATPDENYKSSLKNQQYGVPDTESLTELVERGGIETATGPAGTLILFECNTLHGSNANMSPFPRSNAFFVYNSVHNPLHAEPFAAPRRRPAFLAHEDYEPLEPA